MHRQTDRQTDRQTNTAEKPAPPVGIGNKLTHLCLQCNEIVLKAFVFLDIALHGLEVSAKLLWNTGVLLLHAGQRILDVAVEPMEFPGTVQLLISSLYLCQKSLPAISTTSKHRT